MLPVQFLIKLRHKVNVTAAGNLQLTGPIGASRGPNLAYEAIFFKACPPVPYPITYIWHREADVGCKGRILRLKMHFWLLGMWSLYLHLLNLMPNASPTSTGFTWVLPTRAPCNAGIYNGVIKISTKIITTSAF